MHYGYTDS